MKAMERKLAMTSTIPMPRISDGTVIIRDEAYRIVETLTNVEFALAWPSISRTFATTGQFTWNGQPFDATLSLSDFLAALTGDRTGLKVRLTGAPFKFAFDGNMSHRPTLKMEGVLAADASSLRETLRWATDQSMSPRAARTSAMRQMIARARTIGDFA